MIRGSFTVFITAALLCGAAGCAARLGNETTAQGGPIRAINVMTVPVALNLDNVPGPDGFSVKVYANNAENPKPVPLRDGSLEILMFNGTFYGKTEVPAPIKTWSYSAEELQRLRFDAGIGTGYEFVLTWGRNIPTERMITIAARYTSSDQKIVTSKPSSVTVANK